jgi:hypothetical protein
MGVARKDRGKRLENRKAGRPGVKRPGKPYPKGYIREDLKQYQFERVHYKDEACSKGYTLRLPPSIVQRIQKFKEQEGRSPTCEIRDYLDEILPPLEETTTT